MDTLELSDLTIGTPAPDFELQDLDGRTHRLSERRGSVVILNFWSAECPWAERGDRLLAACREEWGAEIHVWWIDANANETPELMRSVADARRIGPVLIDPAHTVADLYGAATTPHFYVVDGGGVLRYRGAPDDVHWAQKQRSKDYLGPAVTAALAERTPDPSSTPAFGCSLVRFPPESLGLNPG